MTSSPDNTVEILMKLSDDVQGQRYLLERGEITLPEQIDKVWVIIQEAKQSLDSHYLSIFLEEIDNELSMPNPLQPVTALFRLKKLRKALQDRLGGSNVTNKKEVI